MGKVLFRFFLAFSILFIFHLLPYQAFGADDPSVDQYLKNIQDTPDQNPSATTGEKTTDPSISLWALALRALIALILILLLLYGMAGWLKKGRKGREPNEFHVLSSLWVSQQKSIKLVRVGSHLFLIGVGENLTLLYHFEKEEEAAALIEALERRDLELENRTLPLLFQALNRFRKKDQGRDHFQEELVSQLERLRVGEREKEKKREGEHSDEG